MNNLAGTMLEQMIVAKGGVACVSSGIPSISAHWGARATDFLLQKIMHGHRYQNVICLALDRRLRDIRSMTNTNNNGNTQSPSDEHDVKSVTILHRSMSTDGSIPGAYSAVPRKDISVVLSEAYSVALAAVAAGKGNTAVVVYSLSEIILAAGEERALNWLEMMSGIGATDTTVDPTAKEKHTKGSGSKKMLIIAVVHASLHSAATLARVEALCQTVSFIIPCSEGLLSTTGAKVVIEARTVRRAHVGASASSSRSGSRTDFGRPSEGVDLFALGPRYTGPSNKAAGGGHSSGVPGSKFDQVIFPCAAMKNKMSGDGKKKSSGVRQIPSRAAADTVANKTTLVIENSEKSSSSSSINALSSLSIDGGKAAAITTPGIVNSGTNNLSKTGSSSKSGSEPKRLLVTYDNNDPEFDEDSDPDGDLEF